MFRSDFLFPVIVIVSIFGFRSSFGQKATETDDKYFPNKDRSKIIEMEDSIPRKDLEQVPELGLKEGYSSPDRYSSESSKDQLDVSPTIREMYSSESSKDQLDVRPVIREMYSSESSKDQLDVRPVIREMYSGEKERFDYRDVPPQEGADGPTRYNRGSWGKYGGKYSESLEDQPQESREAETESDKVSPQKEPSLENGTGKIAPPG